MTKKRNTKQALLTSGLALLMCITMLVGSTFAWFTDSVTSSNNKIKSGNLKIDLEVLENGTYKSVKNSTDPIFSYDKWEPGYTQVKTLKIQNEGDLALKYQLNVIPENANCILANVIDVYMCFGESTAKSAADLADTSKWWKCGTLAEMMAKPEGFTQGKLLPVGADYDGELLGENGVAIGEITASIALHMQETAGNEYQNLDLGSIDIQLFATQFTYEKDSFNDQYDKEATYLNKDSEGKYLINNASEMLYFANSVNKNGENYSGKTVVLTADIDLAGINWTPIGQTGATEFKGVFDGQGHTIKNMTVNNTDASGDCSSGLFGWIESHGDENVTIKNVKFENANVTGYHNVAVVAGYVYGTIENCEVKDSTVTAINANDDANGDKVGAIAGYVGDSKINGNKVDNCVVNGNRDVGGLAGVVHNGVLSFKNNSVKNTTVYYATEKSYASAGKLFSGRVNYTADSSNTSENVVVVKLTKISTAEEFVAAFANLKAGDILSIANDIDMSGKTITPVSGNKGFTMLGNGYTISNLKSTDSALFVANSGSSSYTFDGVVLENCIVNTTSNYGALFVGDGDTSDAITIKNCVVKNCSVTSEKYAAAFVGYTAGWNVVNDGPVYSDVLIEGCSVIGGSITGNGSVAAAVAHAGANVDTTTTVKNLTVSGVAINGEDAEHTGIVVGTANVGKTIISGITYDNVTGNYNTTHVIYGRFVPNATGTLTIDDSSVQ